MGIILHICSWNFSGMRIGYDGKRAVRNFTGLGNYSRYVVQSLSAFAPENEYWLYAPSRRENGPLAAVVAGSGGAVSLHYPSSRLWRWLGALWRVAGVCGALERDGIRLFHGLSNELPLTVRRVRGMRSVVTVHDLIFRRLPHCYPLADRLIYDFKCRFACRRADRIIAVSECTKRDIMHYYGIPAEKISVVYQGCNPLYARRAGEGKLGEVRRRYRLPGRYILSVGTIEKRKNALAAARALKSLSAELHLVLAGRPTAYVRTLKKFIAEAGLRERVHFLHGVPQEDLPAVYQCAETFVYPSFYEGFGIPVLEALSSGVPVVAATGSCLEEAGGRHSLYADPHDEKGLAEAIAFTLKPSVRAAMIEEGLKWARKFSQERTARETLECYRKALEGD